MVFVLHSDHIYSTTVPYTGTRVVSIDLKNINEQDYFEKLTADIAAGVQVTGSSNC